MDSSDESTVLLSTMSPIIKNKLNPGQKRFRRVAGASILALKRNVRRSSLYEKSVTTPKNEELVLADSRSSTESCDSEKWNILNKTPIIISDTDHSSDEEVEKVPDSITELENIKKSSLSDQKLNDIECWITKVNAEETCDTINTNSTFFSELSTIQGDTGDNYLSEGIGQAVNSTFSTPLCKRFHELFGKHDKKDAIQSLENLVIDDSLDNSDRSLKTKLITACSEDEKQNNICSSPKINQYSPRETNEEYEDMENMLDTLYGHSWRAKKELVLPKTEPRKNKKNSNLPLKTINSERKPNSSFQHKNPYLNSVNTKPRNLWKGNQNTQLKTPSQTSLAAMLRELCDPDTSSDNSPIKALPRTKLSFNSNETDDHSEDKISKSPKTKLDFTPNISDDNEKTSKYFQNDPGSDLPRSLGSRIKKKNKGIKVPAGTYGETGKNYLESHKENIETPMKKISKPKSTPRKQRSISSSSSEDQISATRSSLKNQENLSNVSLTSDDEWDKEMSKMDHSAPIIINGTYSFLASLSNVVPISECDMSARIYRNNFKTFRGQLTNKLFVLFNENIFENSIPQDTVLEWNERLLNTAGQCVSRKTVKRSGKIERSVKIVLSNKVLDSSERLRDTLVHEMCHAATWIVNCVSDGHGKYWKAWAYKAMKTFPELPQISRCHNYVINTKYTYKCTGCGYSIGRHSKSLDIERKRCGYCLGKFEVLVNKTTKKGITKSVPATPKKEATGFALFVKENYGIYKTPEVKHGDVMKILGQKFQKLKVKS